MVIFFLVFTIFFGSWRLLLVYGRKVESMLGRKFIWFGIWDLDFSCEKEFLNIVLYLEYSRRLDLLNGWIWINL